MMTEHVDALVVGAGFSGIYQLKKLRDQGLKVKAIEAGSGVGGTWFWNRYPGAMSDTEAYLYRYSWDSDDLQSYPWSRHYLQGPEVLAYLEHMVKRHDLGKDIELNTRLVSAEWDEVTSRWNILTSSTSSKIYQTRYLVTALGILSKQNLPPFPNREAYRGQIYHTGSWPTEGVDLRGKRVGVIGNGSTGVQVITAIAKDVKQLVCFQRSPQYSVPSGDAAIPDGYREDINKRYNEIWKQVKKSKFAFGIEESERLTASVSPEEREQIYETAWQRGGGFRFAFGTFGDISVDEEANGLAADFIKRKIASIVHDPDKARKLTPAEFYARRPLCDAGYYEQFNRENVDIVSLKETPITSFTATGIKTSDGVEYGLDVVICATGFDAVDGNYLRASITGRGGLTLKDHWSAGPSSYLGMFVPRFPNMFMVLGPNGPFTNIPPTIETQVEFISDLIQEAERRRHGGGGLPSHDGPNGTSHAVAVGGPIVEAREEAEGTWTQHCDDLSKDSLYRRTDSWIFGANIPGKKHSVLFYFGGLAQYRQLLAEEAEGGRYPSFQPF
ncbi:cyclohexanone monooxygenase [Fonsecaea erecta]|uniref:Cyclohexanone monooxygenase n=1 Tax=Fonsecaea erecta TaxID=1367422 RepID=A0A178ZFJ6_9EURO|nr:cyclohexanone monooxygenase [Fonsecaea erecta]OAP57835.1 cyclohexanone monooxygenase [Fonsecaea erecta]